MKKRIKPERKINKSFNQYRPKKERVDEGLAEELENHSIRQDLYLSGILSGRHESFDDNDFYHDL